MQKVVRLTKELVITSDHALHLPEKKAIVIADLHIGYEASLQAEGVAIPDFQFEIMFSRIEKLLERYRPEIFLINGDLKHEFSRNRGQEWDEIYRVLELISDRGALLKVVRGNHDNYLKTILAGKDVELMDHVKLNGVEFVHGHKVRDEKKGFRVYGHEHPVIRLKDEIGALMTLPCFLYDEGNGFLIQPAFSPLASGTNVISPTRRFMNPELHDLDISKAKVFAIGENGILDFSTVENLRGMEEFD